MLPPHPKDAGPLLGSVPGLVRDFLGTFVNGWREVGDVCRYRGPRPMVLVAHPDDVQRVLVDRQEIYPRSQPIVDGLRPIMGEGLFVSAGPAHRRARGLMDPLLTPDAVAPYADGVVAAAEAMTATWSGTIDVQAEMMRLAMVVTCDLLFGAGDGPSPDALATDLKTAADYAIPLILLPFSPPAVVQPAYHRAQRALRHMDQLVLDAVRSRRRALASGLDPGDDLLSAMLTARAGDAPTGLGDVEVRDEVMTALFGAFKGIGIALAWLFWELGRHPEIASEAADEVRGVLDGSPPTLQHLGKLPRMSAAIAEALRLHPPLWLWSRPPTEPDTFRGYEIPAGMFVLNIPYITHRHPEFWPDPEAFDPARFEPATARERHPFAYFPFGGGVRGCIGENLSLLVVTLVAAHVASRFRLEAVAGHEPHHSMDFTLRTDNGLPMRTMRVA